MELDSIDKKILNRIQGDFPLSVDPYADIGRDLSMEAACVLGRVRAMKEAGIIRKVGPFFDPGRLGHLSTLCAVDVEETRLEEAARVINSYSEVTHNYLREGSPNLWFTVIAESRGAIDRILSEIGEKASIGPIMNLPAKKVFKIRVDLKVKE